MDPVRFVPKWRPKLHGAASPPAVQRDQDSIPHVLSPSLGWAAFSVWRIPNLIRITAVAETDSSEVMHLTHLRLTHLIQTLSVS